MTETATSPKPLLSERGPGRNYDLYASAAAVELRADGAAGVALGPAVSRMDFHRVIQVDPNFEGGPLETRERHLSVVLPTPQLIEFLTSTLASVTANKDALLGAMEETIISLRDMLDKVSVKR